MTQFSRWVTKRVVTYTARRHGPFCNPFWLLRSQFLRAQEVSPSPSRNIWGQILQPNKCALSWFASYRRLTATPISNCPLPHTRIHTPLTSAHTLTFYTQR